MMVLLFKSQLRAGIDMAEYPEEALEEWRHHPEHVVVQRQGRQEFYQSYAIQALRSVRDYAWERPS